MTDPERDLFEQAALAHFVTERARGNAIDDNGAPASRESLFWRKPDGTYGVTAFNAAAWGWLAGRRMLREQCCAVAEVTEQLEDNEARVRWTYNPVPIGEHLLWDHGTCAR